MGALWYALAHPDRVERLVLLGVPTLPKSRCPLPLRLVGTPGLGQPTLTAATVMDLVR